MPSYAALLYTPVILSVPCIGSDHITSALSVRLSSSYTREQSHVVTNGIDIKYLIKIMCCRKFSISISNELTSKTNNSTFFHLTFTSTTSTEL